MDIATVLGIAAALTLIVSSITMEGGSFTAFLDVRSAMIVLGGASAVALISFPLWTFVGVFHVFFRSIFYRLESIPRLQKELVEISEFARRNGLLALESRVPKIRNRFFALGVQMIADGTRPEMMEDILRNEYNAAANRHRDGRAIFECMGRFAPAFGMIGTLLGLVMMLGNMRDPSKIGSGMAVALLTTLYGAIAANVLFLPIAEKLKFIGRHELVVMEVIIRGVVAIQAGEHPRLIEQKLQSLHTGQSLSDEQRAA